MRKIIIAFNGSLFPEAALTFAISLNKNQPILLTGVFIPQAKYSLSWYDAETSIVPEYPLLEEVLDDTITENIDRFKSYCRENRVNFRIHNDSDNFVLPEIEEETRFADLLILASERFYESSSKSQMMAHLKDALHIAECPVIVTPEKFNFPNKNILLYDGSDSSMYAIKQFAYLLPEFCGNETLLMFLRTEEDGEFPNRREIEEFANQHYLNIAFLTLTINPQWKFTHWLDGEENVIVVTGSFGRSNLSQLFKKSFVSATIVDFNVPVFIAHK